MIFKEKKLRKVSDRIFQEANPPEGRNRPLEWRRSFNVLNLQVKRLEVVTSCTIHETEFDLTDERIEHFAKLVKPNIADHLAITGVADEDKRKDHLYCLVQDKKEKEIFSIEKAPTPIKVTVKVGDPTEQSEHRPAGLYWGNAFPLDFDPRDEGLQFELRIPRNQMLHLLTALKADQNATLDVQVRLLSFTYEVDDALREPYHPQDILITSTPPCFISWIGVTSKIGNHFIPPIAENDEDEIDRSQEEQPTPEQRSHAELMHVLVSYLKPLNGVVTALWVLIVVLILYAIFK